MLNKLKRYLPSRWKSFSSALVCGFIFILSCKEDSPVGNLPPDSFISVEKINRTGENRLNTSVYLSWFGTDKDGYVQKYEISIDNGDWFSTTSRDSVFKFSIDAGVDTADVVFKVRSVDDKGVEDPTPATLSVPLRNSPPEVSFEESSFPADTAFSVVTFRWNYTDPDGDATVASAELKVNDGDWFELDRSKIMISLRAQDPKLTGTGSADLFYNTERKVSGQINGFVNGGVNTFYLRVTDQAGTQSIIDTSASVVVKPQTSDLLLISGQPPDINKKYRELVENSYGSIDAVDFAIDQGQYQPRFWNPTFTLLTELYDKLVFNCDQSLFTNPINGQSGLLLEFAAEVLQNYTDGGGKSLITTSFPAGFDPEPISGALPIDSLSTTSGQAVINADSAIYAVDGSGIRLSPHNLVLGVDPFVPTVDAEVFYRAEISTFGAWEGPDIVGAIRRDGSNVKQVFFSVELYLYSKNPNDLQGVFDDILLTKFNW